MSAFNAESNTIMIINNGTFSINDILYESSDLPITISNIAAGFPQITITILLGISALISDVSQYLIAGTDKITFDGMNQSFPINVVDYPGFIQNGTQDFPGNSNIIVQNINIVHRSDTTMSENSGVICQQYFTGTVKYCSSAINLVSGCGGIVGANAVNVMATNCYSTGQIGSANCFGSGGIFGTTSTSCHANDCFSTGNIYGNNSNDGNANGGIYANNSADCQANKCYSIGMIGNGSGGIFGEVAQNSNATDCYSIGSIGVGGGGIFGRISHDMTAINCYSTGTIGEEGGGIVGKDNNSNTVTSCYTTGIVSVGAGSIYGIGGLDDPMSHANNCYAVGTGSSDSNYFAGDIGVNTDVGCMFEPDGMWRDANASICLGTEEWISAEATHPYLLKSFVQTIDTGVAMFGSSSGYCYQFITRTNPTTGNGTSAVQLVNGSYQQALEAASDQYEYTDNIYGYNVLTYSQVTDVYSRVIILYVHLKSRTRSYVY